MTGVGFTPSLKLNYILEAGTGMNKSAEAPKVQTRQDRTEVRSFLIAEKPAEQAVSAPSNFASPSSDTKGISAPQVSLNLANRLSNFEKTTSQQCHCLES